MYYRIIRAALAALLFFIAVGMVAATGASEPGSDAADDDARGSSADAQARRRVVDALGRTVDVPADPQRIAVAGRAVLMIADALYMFPSARDRLVGVGRINQGKGNFLRAIDPNYGEKTIFERNVGPEQIASIDPDLVILKTSMQSSLGEGLDLLGIPVVYVNFETPRDYTSDVALLGQVLDEEERATEIVEYYAAQVEAVEAAVGPGTGGRGENDASGHGDEGEAAGGSARPGNAASAPRTLFAYADLTTGEAIINVPPPDWIQTTLVRLAGGEPVWVEAAVGRGWSRVNLEQVAAWSPDVVILVAYRQNLESVAETLAQNSIWSEIVARGNIGLLRFPLDFYSWDQPDVRWILGLHWLARVLNPTYEPDMEALLGEFFAFAYGMSEAVIEEVILSRLEGDIDAEGVTF